MMANECVHREVCTSKGGFIHALDEWKEHETKSAQSTVRLVREKRYGDCDAAYCVLCEENLLIEYVIRKDGTEFIGGSRNSAIKAAGLSVQGGNNQKQFFRVHKKRKKNE